MTLQDDSPQTDAPEYRSQSTGDISLARLHRHAGPLAADRVLEWVTFGRRPLLLFRIWVVQVVLLLADVGVFRSVYPFLAAVFRPSAIPYAALALSGVFLTLLWSYLSKMALLTFATRYHRVRFRLVSTAGYLGLGGAIVAVAFAVIDVTPVVPGEPVGLHGPLAAMLTTGLAALLALGFYAQFGAASFPRRRHTQRVVDEWLASLDWHEHTEGTTEKDRRYTEFTTRTRQVADLLDAALTAEGRALRDDFHDWHASFEAYSLLTQERILSGDARNPELRDHYEQLQRLRHRLAFLADVADTPESGPHT